MSTTSTNAPAAALSDDEKKTRAVLAKAMWLADTDTKFADNAARDAAYKEVRKAYFAKARKLAKYLEKRNIALTPTAAD